MKLRAHSVILTVLLVTTMSCQKGGVLVKEELMGEEWPLLVSEGYVKCVGDYAVIISIDDHTYAVNKAAMEMNQFEDIRPITKDKPNLPKGQAKMSLSRIEFEGLKLCKPKK